MEQVQAAAPSDREYETIFILKPGVTRESSEGLSARIADVVSRGGGKLTRVENLREVRRQGRARGGARAEPPAG
jgi:hypothetical protein